VERGVHQVKFTVTNEKATFFGVSNNNAFFRVTGTDPTTGQNLLGDEKLWWGRCRYDPLDIAICEVRSIGAVSRQMIDHGIELSYFPKDFAKGRLHFRYLAADSLYDWPESGQVTVGKMTISDSDRWSAESEEKIESVTVPAGSFPQCLRTDFKFSMSGLNEKNYIEEKLYYQGGTGLIKWTQSEQGEPVWTAELTSFDVGRK
jgi:hypothetical protein